MEPYSPDLIPCVFYADLHAGIAFLKHAIGFEDHLLVPGPNGSLAHVELRLGRAIVMPSESSKRGAEFDWKAPIELGGAVTSGIYVAVPNVDELFARARDAGAIIGDELHDTDYGSRDFSITDPGGNRWSFGTYHPLAEHKGDDNAGAGFPAEAYSAHRYRDAPKAITFLCQAFGFEEHFVVPEGDAIAHAQLRFGSSILMLGSARDDAYAMATPAELGAVTGAMYAIVDDIDAHAARAKAAGATIVKAPYDSDHGSRDYVARDQDGYLWFFGTFRPDRPLEP